MNLNLSSYLEVSAMKRFLLVGFLLWLGGTLLLRLAPVGLLAPDRTLVILLLYAGSFGLAFILVRQAVARPLEASEARRAGIALVLPTLVLDAFTSAFFPAVYPNLAANAAGVFGGWMLICCGGGLLAVLQKR
jgi:uncharacterized protein DUF5367